MPENSEQGSSGYYISSMRIRRVLSPVLAVSGTYRCITHAVDGPEASDKVLANQIEFENVLITMKLKKPRNAAEWLFAKAWLTELDRLAGRPKPGEPLETLLRPTS